MRRNVSFKCYAAAVAVVHHDAADGDVCSDKMIQVFGSDVAGEHGHIQQCVFGWRHGVDLVGGGEPGAVRLIYALTINCWSKASKQQLDPAPSQNLFRYVELKDGKIHDITRYIKFRNEKKR